MLLVAIITDPVDRVGVGYQGIDLGIELKDDGNSSDFGSGDGIYGLGITLGNFAQGGRFPLNIEAELGTSHSLWPYLVVE